MLREILGLALISVGLISIIAHIIATGRRAARHPYDSLAVRTTPHRETPRATEGRARKNP
jgi:hypothetical protein